MWSEKLVLLLPGGGWVGLLSNLIPFYLPHFSNKEMKTNVNLWMKNFQQNIDKGLLPGRIAEILLSMFRLDIEYI